MPEIFGLHDNANITFAQNETFALLGSIVQLQPKSSSVGGQGREEVGVGCGEGPTRGSTILPVPCEDNSVCGILQELREASPVPQCLFAPTDSRRNGQEHSGPGA